VPNAQKQPKKTLGIFETSPLSPELRVKSFEGAYIFANLAIQSVIYVNGGAVIALIAFLGNRWKPGDPNASGLLDHTIAGVTTFGVGVLLGVLSALCAFVAQISFAEERKAGGHLRAIAAMFCILGAVAFAVGTYLTVSGVLRQ
jgi:hypothetical protein